MKACIYLRVSTQKQNDSHLGIESQRSVCLNYIQSIKADLLNEFIDVESGKSRERVGLLRAIDYCKENECMLVFAKLDRLARDVEFTFKVINTGIQVHFCDMPQLNTLILGVMATVAQYERELISQRTKAALKAKKERGELTGGACRKVSPNLSKASEASAQSRREKARINPANKAFWEFISDYQMIHGKITANTNFQPISDELNKRGKVTSSGLPFDKKRARAMYVSLKNIYEL